MLGLRFGLGAPCGRIAGRLEVGAGAAGTFVEPGIGSAIGVALVDGLWASLVDHESIEDSVKTALTSGVLAFVGGKAAEHAIAYILERSAVQNFIREYGEEVGQKFVAKLLAVLGKDGCFVAGTLVQVAAADVGKYANPLATLTEIRRIGQIRIGDIVATRNVETGKTEFKKVLATTVHTVKSLVVVTLTDRKTGRVVESIRATPEHPFFVRGKGFTPAGSLCIGNAVVTRAGPDLVVTSVTIEEHPEGVAVYNFTVEDDHTYFVGGTGSGIWVHNQCVHLPLKAITLPEESDHRAG